jgi:hypothetical protein
MVRRLVSLGSLAFALSLAVAFAALGSAAQPRLPERPPVSGKPDQVTPEPGHSSPLAQRIGNVSLPHGVHACFASSTAALSFASQEALGCDDESCYERCTEYGFMAGFCIGGLDCLCY